ncbi:MAG: 7-cyano-7-deazaguanine synthase [Methanomicrobiales archaeon]
MSAAHSGDHAIYPDCRPVFVSAMETALHLCDWTDITLHAPYLHLTKADIVKLGTRLGVDYSLPGPATGERPSPAGCAAPARRGWRRSGSPGSRTRWSTGESDA